MVPNRGPDEGGTEVLLRGNNFNPFHFESIDNHNDTFCRFEGLAMVPAKVINSTKVYCTSPPSYVLRESVVEITLNNQEYSDNGVIFYYFRPPQVYDIVNKEGPTSGNTTVYAVGANFRNSTYIKCKFDDIVVDGEYIDHSHIKCVSPPYPHPAKVPFAIAFEPDEFSSGTTVEYTYYETPVVTSIEPICGPQRGFT